MKKDTILKNITKETIKDLLKYFIGLEIDDFEFLDIEFEKIEAKKTDVLVKSKDKIIHIEFQSSNDYNMPIRMARYFLEIYSRFKEYDIFQYVLYIGKQKSYMKNGIFTKSFNYEYTIIDTKTIPCDRFLKIDKPEALVLAILCDFEDKDPKEVIRNILLRLYHLSKDENDFKKYLLMLEELSTSRDLKEVVKEEEMGLQHLKWEDLPSYEIGMEKGFQKGIQKGIEEGKYLAMKEIANKLILTFNDKEKVADILGVDEKTLSELLK
ncbi:MAG: hypothetical protein ABGX26_03270 [Nautiliaceae bacterium]